MYLYLYVYLFFKNLKIEDPLNNCGVKVINIKTIQKLYLNNVLFYM